MWLLMFDFGDVNNYNSHVLTAIDSVFDREWEEFCDDDGEWWRGMDEEFRGSVDPYCEDESTESAFLDAWWTYTDDASFEEVPR